MKNESKKQGGFKMKDKMVQCPKCKGKGEYDDKMPNYSDGFEWEAVSVKCELCDGTGRITKEIADKRRKLHE